MQSLPPPALWLLKEPAPEQLLALQGSPLPPIVQRLLALRNVGATDKAEAFLNPRLSSLTDPFNIPGMDAAVTRILEAVTKNQNIVLYGDYDVDGVTSLTLLTLTLRAYGLDPCNFLPTRMDEGYGLSHEGLARCFEEHGPPDLLIALDCGTGSVAEVEWLCQQGVDCVIVDHHEPGVKHPPCISLVNPKITGENDYFCTVGLVFKLAHALLKRQRPQQFDLREHLDLVALGTVADLVPLHEENRILVHRGLERLSATPRPGLRALKFISGMDGHVQTQHISFRLGPRLNAVGRLETAQTALDLLLCDNPTDARLHAQHLDTSNRERQEIEASAQREAVAMIEANPQLLDGPALIIGSRNWHPGVVGIVASRLMRDHHRPTIVIAFDEDGMGKGSGRSVPGISLVDALHACRPLIEKGGGHAMAAGVSLREENLDAFRDAMGAAIRSQIVGDELVPKVHIDAEVQFSDLTPEFLSSYARLEPYGMGNPEPIFLARNVFPDLPGNVIKEKHWKLILSQGGEIRSAMWFNAEWSNPPAAPWDVIFKLQRQVWRGVESWQLMINDVRSSDDAPMPGRR